VLGIDSFDSEFYDICCSEMCGDYLLYTDDNNVPKSYNHKTGKKTILQKCNDTTKMKEYVILGASKAIFILTPTLYMLIQCDHKVKYHHKLINNHILISDENAAYVYNSRGKFIMKYKGASHMICGYPVIKCGDKFNVLDFDVY
jgi:hypothetical protein